MVPVRVMVSPDWVTVTLSLVPAGVVGLPGVVGATLLPGFGVAEGVPNSNDFEKEQPLTAAAVIQIEIMARTKI